MHDDQQMANQPPHNPTQQAARTMSTKAKRTTPPIDPTTIPAISPPESPLTPRLLWKHSNS